MYSVKPTFRENFAQRLTFEGYFNTISAKILRTYLFLTKMKNTL